MLPERQDDRPRIALAVDDTSLRAELRQSLERTGVEAVEIGALPHEPTALEDLADRLVDAEIDAVAIRDDDGCERMVEWLAARDAGVIVFTETDDPHRRAELLAIGASGVYSLATERRSVARSMEELAGAEREGGFDGPEVGGAAAEARLSDFISREPALESFRRLVDRVVATDTTLLVMGETGVGKERLARAIHGSSPRHAGPFVSVTCGAIPAHLIESELFGHERGAFTGARDRRRGRFELANGGTILLDEIAELPIELQPRLLTILQRRELTRLGGDDPLTVDVRVIAATNRDLAEEVAEGRFRDDLYYRLNVVELTIPPLRARRRDIPDLAGRFLAHFREALDRPEVRGFANDALEKLVEHPWPGNVRELINVVERAVLMSDGPEITTADLPPALVRGEAKLGRRGDAGESREPTAPNAIPLDPDWRERPLREVRDSVIEQLERAYLEHAVDRANGSVAETARLAGLSTRAISDKLKRYGLRRR